MLVKVEAVPAKNAFQRKACRIGALENFLSNGYECAEYAPEGDDNARRAYNGLLMAIKRQYANEVAVLWRHGRVFLKRLKTAEGAREQ